MKKENTCHLWRVVLMLLVFLTVTPAWSQVRWAWPEKPTNLQVLPAGTGGQALRAIMLDYTKALGVECAHCHVGKAGQPLNTFNFSSDQNPNKGRARAMVRMLASIQGQLSKIELGSERPAAMACVTCHNGKPRPMTIENDLQQTYELSGIKNALSRYEQLRLEHYGNNAYDFSESPLAAFGTELQRRGDLEGAIAVFRLSTKQFPESGSAWHQLADACKAARKNVLAEIYYQKSLEKLPENTLALKMLEEISKERESSRTP